jgi:tryptophanyl-tRNA synthetase
LTIQSALTGTSIADLERSYVDSGYGDLKGQVADVFVDFAAPFRQRTQELLSDRAELDRLLARGAAQAREVAAATLATALERVGFVPAR